MLTLGLERAKLVEEVKIRAKFEDRDCELYTARNIEERKLDSERKEGKEIVLFCPANLKRSQVKPRRMPQRP